MKLNLSEQGCLKTTTANQFKLTDEINFLSLLVTLYVYMHSYAYVSMCTYTHISVLYAYIYEDACKLMCVIQYFDSGWKPEIGFIFIFIYLCFPKLALNPTDCYIWMDFFYMLGFFDFWFYIHMFAYVCICICVYFCLYFFSVLWVNIRVYFTYPENKMQIKEMRYSWYVLNVYLR